jgi:hypothetical protein
MRYFLTHPLLWTVSVIFATYTLWFIADFRRQSRKWALFGLGGLPGLALGLALMLTSKRRSDRREAAAAAAAQAAPVAAAPSPPPDPASEALREVERLLRGRPADGGSPPPLPTDSALAALEALQELRRLDLISEEEFRAKRREILSRM